jgi:hypothetical protein
MNVTPKFRQTIVNKFKRIKTRLVDTKLNMFPNMSLENILYVAV